MATSTGGNRIISITHGMLPVARTVGFCVFAITHGMKLSCPRRFLPWVFAFSPLPTVENRCQARRPYRGSSRFRHYQRYAAGRAYRRSSRFCYYPRYEKAAPRAAQIGVYWRILAHISAYWRISAHNAYIKERPYKAALLFRIISNHES